MGRLRFSANVFHFLSSRYLMIGRERTAAQYRVLLPGTADGIFP